MAALPNTLSVGQLAARSGVRASTLRYYESVGLISSVRTSGNQRQYQRHMLRRVAVVRAAQVLGLTLAEIRSALDGLPQRRTPNKADWAEMSELWQRVLDRRIHLLQKLRNDLTDCIGCGCLSLQSCGLLNSQDRLAEQGPGPQVLLPAGEALSMQTGE